MGLARLTASLTPELTGRMTEGAGRRGCVPRMDAILPGHGLDLSQRLLYAAASLGRRRHGSGIKGKNRVGSLTNCTLCPRDAGLFRRRKPGPQREHFHQEPQPAVTVSRLFGDEGKCIHFLTLPWQITEYLVALTPQKNNSRNSGI